MKHHKKKRHHKSSKNSNSAASSASPEGRDSNARSSEAATVQRRQSTCELCAPQGSESDNSFHHTGQDHECDAPSVDINNVTSLAAFQLRSPDVTAFYCQCAQLHAELHRALRTSSASGQQSTILNEVWLTRLSRQLLAVFPVLFHAGLPPFSTQITPIAAFVSDEPREPTSPTCPFVMLLSILMPSLRKFLAWLAQTKTHWWISHSTSTAMPPITLSGATHSPVVSLLLSQFILHDLITQVIAQCDRLSLLIEENEERETDLAYLAQVVPMPRQTSSSSLASMSSQSSQSRPSSAKERKSYRVPQVKKISIEFEDILAELKLELAGLTESVFENVELTAIRLCRPVMSKDNPKAKESANEFVELLIQQLLEPLSLYIMETATISRAYIFPKIIERCIAVIIDEFVVDSARMNETVGKQLENATTLLRAFCMHIETEYNTNNSAIVAAISEMGLQLLVLDGFKRIDLVLQLCLRNGKEHDSVSHKIAFKANLESLKTSFKRSMTARSGNALSGGSVTPPPIQHS